MVRKLGYLVVGLVVAAQFATGIPAFAQDKSKSTNPKDDPVIRKAMRDLAAVEKDLERHKDNFGGHRQKALESVKDAQKELSQAMQFAGGQAMAKAGGVDINNTSAAKLQALRGINEETAKKIQAGAPYSRKDDLVKRNIVTQEQFNQIKDDIVVGPVAKK
jgi:DNA uptake protein ComE-like DNA-binding protein